tara:strand:- start:31 stop:525 length:495 start_codon:yes stop_codon:yes gene_type:complete
MISDKLENLERYSSLFSKDYIASLLIFLNHNLSRFTPGNYTFDFINHKINVIVFKYPLKDRSKCVIEAHKQFLDIQLTLDGVELIEYFPCSSSFTCLENSSSPSSNDFYIYQASSDIRGHLLALNANNFAIFFPGELHRPMIYEGTGDKQVLKLVIKTPKSLLV